MSFGKKKEDNSGAQAAAGISAAGADIKAATQMTGEESGQYNRSFELGKLLEQIQKYQMGLAQAPQGYLSPEQQFLQQGGELGKAYYQQTLGGVQDPYAAYESQLRPALALASDTINRNAAQRGLLRAGIPIEQMGRAGVDLAIKEAQDRMNFRGQELARGGELQSYMQGQQQQTYGNMANLYGQQQQYGLEAKGREGSGAAAAAQYQAYPYQAQLGQYYGKQGQQGAGIGGVLGMVGGGVLGAAAAPFTGGAINPVTGAYLGAGLGGMAGSQLGRAF